jgi:hypothetical protein
VEAPNALGRRKFFRFHEVVPEQKEHGDDGLANFWLRVEVVLYSDSYKKYFIAIIAYIITLITTYNIPSSHWSVLIDRETQSMKSLRVAAEAMIHIIGNGTQKNMVSRIVDIFSDIFKQSGLRKYSRHLRKKTPRNVAVIIVRNWKVLYMRPSEGFSRFKDLSQQTALQKPNPTFIP